MPRTKRLATAVPSDKVRSLSRRSTPSARSSQNEVVRVYPLGTMDIMEAAESALRHKAVNMALGGDAGMMRYCLSELSAKRLRASGFVLPKITSNEDLPKATCAILQAAAVGTITFQEANELAKLVSVHAEAMRDEELCRRIAYLERQQA